MTKREARRVMFLYLDNHPLTHKAGTTVHGQYNLFINPPEHVALSDAAELERLQRRRALQDELSELVMGEYTVELDPNYCLGGNYYTTHGLHNAYPGHLGTIHRLNRVPPSRRHA
jgi:hypothetical protein